MTTKKTPVTVPFHSSNGLPSLKNITDCALSGGTYFLLILTFSLIPISIKATDASMQKFSIYGRITSTLQSGKF